MWLLDGLSSEINNTLQFIELLVLIDLQFIDLNCLLLMSKSATVCCFCCIPTLIEKSREKENECFGVIGRTNAIFLYGRMDEYLWYALQSRYSTLFIHFSVSKSHFFLLTLPWNPLRSFIKPMTSLMNYWLYVRWLESRDPSHLQCLNQPEYIFFLFFTAVAVLHQA